MVRPYVRIDFRNLAVMKERRPMRPALLRHGKQRLFVAAAQQGARTSAGTADFRGNTAGAALTGLKPAS
jgi:hypothetical protein